MARLQRPLRLAGFQSGDYSRIGSNPPRGRISHRLSWPEPRVVPASFPLGVRSARSRRSI